MTNKLDLYDLINSNAIREHCKKNNHKFNIEEIAILIYRNRRMGIVKKISAYNNLINDYEDMPMINKPYYSVKHLIRRELVRLRKMLEEIYTVDDDCFFISYIYNASTGRKEYDINSVSKSYDSTLEKIKKDVKDVEEYNDISEFQIIKKSMKTGYELIIEHYVYDKKIIKTNIYDSKKGIPDLGMIFLNIPTPFKKGDLLYCNTNKLYGEKVFCLDNMITWKKDFAKRLVKGNYDDTDMVGNGYFIIDGNLIYDTCCDFDNWEYFDGDLKDMERILIGVSNLIKENIDLDLFIQAYNTMKVEYMSFNKCITSFTEKGLMLAGFDNKDIERLKKE